MAQAAISFDSSMETATDAAFGEGRGAAFGEGRGAASAALADAEAVADARASLDRILELQARIRGMQETKLDTRALPTVPALAPLLPGGALRAGSSYAVHRSAMLAMAMLAGPSAAGSWCAVVGVPSFGAEAAAGLGIDLERLVLVPEPGDQWLGVTAAMADVVTVVLTRPPGRVNPGDLARLSARLRQRGAALVVLGDWPQSEATLRVSSASWEGIGHGHGHLAARQVTVTSEVRGAGRPVSTTLWLPDARAGVSAVEPVAVPARPDVPRLDGVEREHDVADRPARHLRPVEVA
ncbi:hypothetical protein [Labedella endophytica]|uniref:Recombinase A n=1 Tax=Labedella endophytica TaxID=1523160 RepID=A0A3S0XLA8_9MICO|nr:hypothetical protein [Labedella endophytica]RUQ98982.1 hypothetical protein ELQ94_11695 [Labedella endophytica]